MRSVSSQNTQYPCEFWEVGILVDRKIGAEELTVNVEK